MEHGDDTSKISFATFKIKYDEKWNKIMSQPRKSLPF